jgi:ATP-dependent RNA helicase RhlE
MTFETMNLDPRILSAVREAGYEQPTPIQSKVVPEVLAGRDIMAAAQTGTGKTASFTLPILHMLNSGRRSKLPRCLVLTPTRELAAQVHESATKYGKHLDLKSAVIFGGVKIQPQIRQIKAGVDILIATPGRLLDHCNQKILDLSKVEIFVLDEADRMLDMGFIPDIRRIIKLLPKERQNLLLSATFNSEISELARTFLSDPVSIATSAPNATATTIAQVFHPVERPKKRHLLVELLTKDKGQQTLVFTRSKHGADRLARQLSQKGFTASAIHGGKAQNARNKALSGFKDGRIQVLVATDIAARGLDISALSKVVNFDLPQVPEDYVHRIGRTGRAGKDGLAVSLVTTEDKKLLKNIERFTGMKIPCEAIPGHQFGEIQEQATTRSEARAPRKREEKSGPKNKQRRSPQNGAGQDSKSSRAKDPKDGARRSKSTRGNKRQPDETRSGRGDEARKPRAKRIKTIQPEPLPVNARRFVVPSNSIRDSWEASTTSGNARKQG